MSNWTRSNDRRRHEAGFATSRSGTRPIGSRSRARVRILLERHHHAAVHAKMVLVSGKLQAQEGVTHVLVQKLERLDVPEGEQDQEPGVEIQAIKVRSRDFH